MHVAVLRMLVRWVTSPRALSAPCRALAIRCCGTEVKGKSPPLYGEKGSGSAEADEIQEVDPMKVVGRRGRVRRGYGFMFRLD